MDVFFSNLVDLGSSCCRMQFFDQSGEVTQLHPAECPLNGAVAGVAQHQVCLEPMTRLSMQPRITAKGY
ncbi:MAG: hypothetical protein U5K99_04205 [Anaerolineales bacterium]|nr:hypothetical protein [Anaerolineales bacterium]